MFESVYEKANHATYTVGKLPDMDVFLMNDRVLRREEFDLGVAGYRPLKRNEWFAGGGQYYARPYWRWAVLRSAEKLEDFKWSSLRRLHRWKVVHSTTHPAVTWSWRDLRPGPGR